MLAVARALARQPKLLLLDELSLGLAPVIVEWLLPVVRQFAQERDCAVLLVEQHVHLALEVADRGYVLSHGRIVLHNDAEHLRANRQLLIASYLGEQSTATPRVERGRTIVSHRSLEDLLASVESPVELLRNSQAGPNVYPGVPAEFTNWRDEQTAWQQTCVLFNQSYHMADLAVEGPDALEAALPARASTASRASPSTRPSTSCPCTPDGYVIGDVILFHLAENRFNLVGRAPGAQLDHLPRRDGRATTCRSSSTSGRRCARDGRRKSYRFQVQGPNAMHVIEKVLGGPPPELKFFNMTTVTIAGKHGPRAAPRHGRPARLGAVRAVGRRRGRARGDRRARARSSACGRSAAAPTRRTRSSRAGSRRRFRPSTPARA